MEGLIVPSKVYGIAAAGRPILTVSALDGEIASLVARHHCGLAVAPSDAAGLAAAVLSCRDHPEQVEAMGSCARRMLEERFSRQGALAQWAQLIDGLTEAGSRRVRSSMPSDR